jgi:hypothetical protein
LTVARNEATYHLLYEKHTDKFIDEYCHKRKIGYDHNMALNLAKIEVMDTLMIAMYKTHKLRNVIFNIYTTFKDDYTIYEKAISKFNLSEKGYT